MKDVPIIHNRNECKKIIFSGNYFFAIIFSFILIIFSGSFTRSAAEDSVTIAIAGPMIGTSFSVGVQYKVGVTAALQSLPDGKLLGKNVGIKIYDDSCSKSIAEKVALELTQSLPEVVIGHSCSIATIAAAPLYARENLLQITPASTNPKVTEMGIKTIFRMIGRDDVQGEVAAERIATHYADRKIGMFHFPGDYSTGLTQTAIAALERRGIKPVIQAVGISSASSYAENILELIDAGVEVLYLVGGGLDAGVFLRQARQLDAPFQVISSDTLVSKVFIEAAAEAGEGVPFTFPPEAAELSSSKPAVEAIRSMGLEPAGYTLLAYAAAEVWFAGVRRAGTFEAGAVAAAIRSAPIETILGPVSFDGKGDIQTMYPPFSWYVWKNGKRVALD